MNKTPEIMARRGELDPDTFVKADAFTKETYRDLYPAINPTRPNLSQSGKVVIITGASRGLGRSSFAASFARAHADAIILLARSRENLAETEKMIESINPSTVVHSIAVDISDHHAVKRAFDEISERLGARTPQVLVNNAGVISSQTPMVDDDPDFWWRTQEVNLRGTFNVTHAFLKMVGPSPAASTTVINITSAAGHYVIQNLSSYNMGRSVPWLAPFMKDTAGLCGGTAVWLASGDRHFLSGRYVAANWDVEELEARKEEIVRENLLTDLKRQQERNLQKKLETAKERVAEANRKKNRAIRELRSEKQRQRNKRVRENLERYKNEQPVIDLERQLQGKLVDTKVLGALDNAGSAGPEFMRVIDTVLTMPGATVEAEYQRRINAINAVAAFCGVEEGRPTPRANQCRRRKAVDDIDPCSSPKRHKTLTQDNVESILQDAMESVRVKFAEVRPTMCFLCVGNPDLPLEKRVAKYATPGSITRHFLRKHVNTSWPSGGVPCNVCDNESLEHKSTLVIHAERAHGTVVRGHTQERLARQLNAAMFAPRVDEH
ncbi:hypothetical protein CNMCM6805_002465 [Aspergillus fumigatiaffinis]|uniref:Uncharacterized protein n=1 Tax=Aspergillus fumigatiaffinis TaxID=340414 RepID=A0A8H4GT96_9EURO|nr:hypothetical protein CNMCM6805_002465 [Aspergillus fumigatiaffinis]